jgi:hypothetical protein
MSTPDNTIFTFLQRCPEAAFGAFRCVMVALILFNWETYAMQDPRKELHAQRDRQMATDPIGTRPTMRANARVAGDLTLFDDDEPADGSSERTVIWRWQLRRRRQ